MAELAVNLLPWGMWTELWCKPDAMHTHQGHQRDAGVISAQPHAGLEEGMRARPQPLHML